MALQYSAALRFSANTCLQVMFAHGLPPGVRDSRGDDLFMVALDREDLETAEWLLVSIGIPLDGPPDGGGSTPANQVQRALGQVFRPGSPTYLRYEKFKRIMEQKGVVFPVESSAEYRARIKAQSAPPASGASR